MASGDLYAYQERDDGTLQPVKISPIPMSKLSSPIKSTIDAITALGGVANLVTEDHISNSPSGDVIVATGMSSIISSSLEIAAGHSYEIEAGATLEIL